MSGEQNARRLALDASVAVKAFVPEEHSTKARGLLARFVRDDAELVVPDLFFRECAHVFGQGSGGRTIPHAPISKT